MITTLHKMKGDEVNVVVLYRMCLMESIVSPLHPFLLLLNRRVDVACLQRKKHWMNEANLHIHHQLGANNTTLLIVG